MTDLANWNWADWTLAFIAAGLAWALLIALGLAVAGAVCESAGADVAHHRAL